MDLIKIGNFIAELRKKQKLTQEQLGEKLGVTNKTVSRWETGTYLPPAEALLAMSELFGVSINELLSGKRLSEAEYKEAAEENLKQTVKTSSFTLKDRTDFYKNKWLKEHRAIIILIGIGIVGVLLVGIILKNAWFVGTACRRGAFAGGSSSERARRHGVEDDGRYVNGHVRFRE